MKLRLSRVNSSDYLTLQAQDCTPPNLPSLLTFLQTGSSLGSLGKLIPGLHLQVTLVGSRFSSVSKWDTACQTSRSICNPETPSAVPPQQCTFSPPAPPPPPLGLRRFKDEATVKSDHRMYTRQVPARKHWRGPHESLCEVHLSLQEFCNVNQTRLLLMQRDSPAPYRNLSFVQNYVKSGQIKGDLAIVGLSVHVWLAWNVTRRFS